VPTYDYICKSCGHKLELFQSMSEAPKRKCPDCGKLKLERQIGMGAGVLFKGSGFYETDYRSDSYQKGAKAEKEAKSSKTEKGSEKKSEPKKKKDKGDSSSAS
jgi:putative FmdB family regulatory protein